MKLKSLPPMLKPLPPMLASLPQERSKGQQREFFAPWRVWYRTPRWAALRLVIFTRNLFTCQWPGCGFVAAGPGQLVLDHRKAHRGDERLFWDEGNLQALCKPCHDSRKQQAERAELR